jgi:hypothetical protein
MKKICTKCKIEKDISEYHKQVSRKEGHHSWCKVCKCLNNQKYKNEERPKETSKEIENRTAKQKLIQHAKVRANKKGLDFDITQHDFEIPEFCPVLGIPIYIGKEKFHDGSPTIDRVDNNKGYIQGNIKVISWRANSIKSDATISEIDKIIKYIKNNVGNNNEQKM